MTEPRPHPTLYLTQQRSRKKQATRRLSILVASLTAREYIKILGLSHYFVGHISRTNFESKHHWNTNQPKRLRVSSTTIRKTDKPPKRYLIHRRLAALTYCHFRLSCYMDQKVENQ